MTARVFRWSCREQPDMTPIAEYVTALSEHGRVFMREVQTGTDENAVAVSDAPLADEQALALYDGEEG